MIFRIRPAPILSFIAILSLGGCGGGRNADLARQAEERGDPAVAYDYYCRAAQDHRGSLTVAAGIERTRPAAAAHWERLALAAADEGRYADAWRCWMRTIEIQPDHATAAQMIRQLESEHSMQIASAREDWLQRGTASLPKAQLEPRGAVADARRDAALPDSEAKPVRETLAARDPRAARALARQPSKPQPRAQRTDSSQTDRSPRDSAAPPRDAAAAPVPTDQPVVDAERPARTPPKHSGPARSVADRAAFEVVRTYSLEDQRFPRTGEAIDGITLKLKDTDEDDGVIDVDLDLLKSGNRIRKVRQLRVGRSLTFRGASGQTYRMTIISAHHRTQTVRIGFRAE